MKTDTQTLTDTSVMPTLHTFFRREYRLAGGLVRGIPEGDEARAAVVADHLDLVGRALHHHHTIEDEMLWPRLLERVPDEMAPIVHLMESQHEGVDRLLAELGELLGSFRATARVEDRDRLAGILDDLYVRLVEHLDAEESRMLPIVARTISQEEWDAMGEAGRASTPRHERLLVLGMYEYDGDPAVIAHMLDDAPAPVRWLLLRGARRAFRRHALRVHGTAAPSRP